MCILVVFFWMKTKFFNTIFLNVLTKIINLEILQIFCQHVFDWRKCSYSGRWSEDERYPTHATRWPCAPQCSHANGNDWLPQPRDRKKVFFLSHHAHRIFSGTQTMRRVVVHKNCTVHYSCDVHNGCTVHSSYTVNTTAALYRTAAMYTTAKHCTQRLHCGQQLHCAQ